MNIVNEHLDQIAAVLGVAILLTLGRAKILPKARGSKLLLWVAFVVTAICGLMLGWALRDLVGWLVTRTSVGGFSIVGLAAVWAGWHAVAMLVDLIRDLADTNPDDDARKAALWVPTLLPAGVQSVWTVVSDPRGVGTGLTAAIMAGVTVGYVGVIVAKAIRGKTARRGWLWFAAAVSLLGGLVMTPLVLYVDGWVSSSFPGVVLPLRLLAGFVGVGLLIGALADIADKVPDALVRLFLRFGLPLLLAYGGLAVAAISSGATSGADLLGGVA